MGRGEWGGGNGEGGMGEGNGGGMKSNKEVAKKITSLLVVHTDLSGSL